MWFKLGCCKVGTSVVCFLCVAVLFVVAAFGESRSLTRRQPQTSPEYEVQRAIGWITFVLRGGDPSAVTGVLGSLRAPGAAPVSQDQAAMFFTEFSAPPSAPLVYFANPRVVIDGSTATVTCLAHWQLMNADGTLVRLKEAERFVFEMDGGRFVLKLARSTPLVIAHGANAADYAKSLIEVDQAMDRSRE